MRKTFLQFDLTDIPAEDGSPPPDRVTEGNPRHQTWNLEDDGAGLYAGVWESSPGEWRVHYTEWEFCHIVAGVSVITEDGGDAVTLAAGDSFVLRPGFRGLWKVVETTRKHYVIRL